MEPFIDHCLQLVMGICRIGCFGRFIQYLDIRYVTVWNIKQEVLHNISGLSAYIYLETIKNMEICHFLVYRYGEYFTEFYLIFQKQHGEAKGGPYLAVHLRRRDFLRGHSADTPTIEEAANQIENVLVKLKLTTVFVATDAPKEGNVYLYFFQYSFS